MKKNGTLSKLLTFALLSGLSFFLSLGLDTGRAHAQERRSFLDRLFGRKPLQAAPPSLQRQRSSRARAYADENASTYVPQTPPVTATRKNDNARRILVVGDFVASAVADGLTRAYHENADMVVIAKTEGASGFVRSDYYNWPAKISDIIAQEKPDVILVMLGANDRQVMKFANKSLDVLTPEWTANYKNRMISFTDALKKSGSAWIWLSLPAFRQQNLNQSVVEFNAYYKQAAEKAGGHFVDTWEGFVDENGNFAFSGYDINGQMARLRANDGINFTPPGRRKLAFYAEQAIQALSGQAPQASGLADEPAFSAQPSSIQRIAPTGLWDTKSRKPALAGATVTNRAENAPHNENSTFPHYKPPRGRADDFRLEKK